jgi:hypothetical protein
MRRLLLVFCLLLATACDEKSPTGPAVPLNERFILAPGEAAAVEHTDLRVQFVEVTGDSRCPGDAVCIQGGDAIVHVRVLEDERSAASYRLHTGNQALAAVTHGSVRITLEELQPYPFASRPTAPGDYRATLSVTRP